VPHTVWYASIWYAGGYLVGLAAFVWMAKRRGMATTGVLLTAGVGLLGGLLGANIAQWLTTGSPGKSVLGALVGGYLAVFLFKKYIGLRRPTGDLFAVAICAGEAVGRWGCFFGGCCYGKPTEVAWAVWQHNALRHPTQIYLSLVSLGILLLLLWWELRSPQENFLFAVQGILYCTARFIIEFFRETPHSNSGLSTAQWACLIGIVFFIAKFRGLLQENRRAYVPLSRL
jgi:phosphatidylglycerol---prolipoprotein diacylglyceryl transferase